jgi:hypothetical protein
LVVLNFLCRWHFPALNFWGHAEYKNNFFLQARGCQKFEKSRKFEFLIILQLKHYYWGLSNFLGLIGL